MTPNLEESSLTGEIALIRLTIRKIALFAQLIQRLAYPTARPRRTAQSPSLPQGQSKSKSVPRGLLSAEEIPQESNAHHFSAAGRGLPVGVALMGEISCKLRSCELRSEHFFIQMLQSRNLLRIPSTNELEN